MVNQVVQDNQAKLEHQDCLVVMVHLEKKEHTVRLVLLGHKDSLDQEECLV